MRVQVVARSSPDSKKRPTAVPTRADGLEKYETHSNSAGGSQIERSMSKDPSTFYSISLASR